MAVVGKGSRTANASRVAQGTEDVNFTLPNNTDDIVLGCGVGDDNGDRMELGPPADIVRLEFKTGGDAFATVVSGSGAVRLGLTDLVEGNRVAAGERLSTGLFGAYIDGVEVETTNPSAQAERVRDDTTEFQWSLDFNNAVASTQYDFRVFWEHKNGGNNVTYISITTVAAAADPFPAQYRAQHLSPLLRM